MRRHSGPGDKPVKKPHRKTQKPKQGDPSKAARHRNSSATSPETQVARLTRELQASLARENATSEVLSIISSSPGELKPVFNAMLENAVRLCEAEFGNLFLYDGEAFHAAAVHSASQAYTEVRRRPIVLRELHPDVPIVRMTRTKAALHIADVKRERSYEHDPIFAQFVDVSGARSTLYVPMLKEIELIGAFIIYRLEVRPFTDKQIELVKTFAAQAVIAIENARLLNELRQSLERQTATSEVLGVISRSPGELETVFHAILENATRICEANFGILQLLEGEAARIAAMHNVPAAMVEHRQRRPLLHVSPESAIGRAIATRRVVHIPDYAADAAYGAGDPSAVNLVQLAGARSLITVPMLKDDELIGIISIYRQEVRPFTDKHIELVQNFAAQAVIAIENARLLNELRQRTTDLSETLEQQTATADVLSVISSSPGELKPVFQTILENATRICEAKFGLLFRFDGKTFQLVAEVGASAELAEFYERRGPFHPGGILERLLRTKDVVCVADASAEPVPPPSAKIGGAKSSLNVPMFKDEAMVGAITIYRQEVRPFTDRQIALLENFAAQAVIAIENAGLLNELRDRTQEVVKLNQQLEQRVADQVGEIERMGRLRRFLPPQVADLIVASGTEKQLESHRREITALFCDLRGFTGFSESSDPEDVMSLLADYHAAIGTIINKYSGTLERYAGDGVMVIFNDPVPVDNPALQAVLMALEMRTAIGGLIEKWRDLGHDLGFGIGIAHGFATLGTIGFEGRRDYAAIGTVSNVASRLCDEAKPGQILISSRVRQSVEKAVTVESVGEFTLKGIRRPMMACNVLASSTSKSN
jgi:GAF domain-containing protein